MASCIFKHLKLLWMGYIWNIWFQKKLCAPLRLLSQFKCLNISLYKYIQISICYGKKSR